MAPKGVITKEELEGIGVRAAAAVREGLPDHASATLAHLSCECPVYTTYTKN